MTNFKDKANIFNNFFGKQCQPIPNNSTLPSIWTSKISNRLGTVDIDSMKIPKLIQCLNSNKARGHNDISIRLLKLCGLSIIKPLSLLFSNCLRDGTFTKVLLLKSFTKVLLLFQTLFQGIKREINK